MKKILIYILKFLIFLLLLLIVIGGSIFGFSYANYQKWYTSVTEIEKENLLSSLKESDIILSDSGALRRTWNTLMSIPEWFIVSISDDYTSWLEQGNNPSDFPYFGYLMDYWYLYGRITSIMDYKIPRDYEYHTMVRVIGVSTTLEFGLKGLYEFTLWRLTSLIQYNSEEDTAYHKISRDYVHFILLRPWYEFDFRESLSRFDCHFSSLRWTERCFLYGWELLLKKYYAKVIEDAAHSNFAIPNVWTEVGWVFPESVTQIDTINIVKTENGIKITRYYPFTEYLPKVLSESGTTVTSIAWNKKIVVEAQWPSNSITPREMFARIPLRTEPSIARTFSLLPVESLKTFLLEENVKISHIYDF